MHAPGPRPAAEPHARPDHAHAHAQRVEDLHGPQHRPAGRQGPARPRIVQYEVEAARHPVQDAARGFEARGPDVHAQYGQLRVGQTVQHGGRDPMPFEPFRGHLERFAARMVHERRIMILVHILQRGETTPLRPEQRLPFRQAAACEQVRRARTRVAPVMVGQEHQAAHAALHLTMDVRVHRLVPQAFPDRPGGVGGRMIVPVFGEPFLIGGAGAQQFDAHAQLPVEDRLLAAPFADHGQERGRDRLPLRHASHGLVLYPFAHQVGGARVVAQQAGDAAGGRVRSGRVGVSADDPLPLGGSACEVFV